MVSVTTPDMMGGGNISQYLSVLRRLESAIMHGDSSECIWGLWHRLVPGLDPQDILDLAISLGELSLCGDYPNGVGFFRLFHETYRDEIEAHPLFPKVRLIKWFIERGDMNYVRAITVRFRRELEDYVNFHESLAGGRRRSEEESMIYDDNHPFFEEDPSW